MSKQAVAAEPVRKDVTVALPVEDAFRLFTREIATWWPTATHSLATTDVRDVVLEEREGGTVYEVTASGEHGHWATVLAWEPPHRLLLSWEVAAGRAPTEVEVRFTATPEGTLLELEHRHWERLGDEAASVRESYDGGWDVVLAPYAAAAG